MADKRDPPLVESVLRSIRLLDIISRHQPITLSEMSRKSALKKTTVARLAATLRQADMINQDPGDKRFSMSIRAFELGSRVLDKLDVRKVARPLLEEFVTEKGMSVLVSILDRNDVIFVDKITAPEVFRISMTVGSRAPAYCSASGKAMLAFLDPGERCGILTENPLSAFTNKTVTNMEAIEKDLAQTRESGFALDFEERCEGLYSVAAPIFGPMGKVLAAVSIPRMAAAITREEMFEIGRELVVLANKVSGFIGGGRVGPRNGL